MRRHLGSLHLQYAFCRPFPFGHKREADREVAFRWHSHRSGNPSWARLSAPSRAAALARVCWAPLARLEHELRTYLYLCFHLRTSRVRRRRHPTPSSCPRVRVRKSDTQSAAHTSSTTPTVGLPGRRGIFSRPPADVLLSSACGIVHATQPADSELAAFQTARLSPQLDV